jgi:hypothetical protein
LLAPLVETDGTVASVTDYNSVGLIGAVSTTMNPATYAAELFSASDKAIATTSGVSEHSVNDPSARDNSFLVGVKIDISDAADAAAASVVYLKVALDGVPGATWGGTGTATGINAQQALFCSAGAGSDPTTCTSVLLPVAKGDLTSTGKESVADFVIQKTGTGTFGQSNYFFLVFDADDLTALQNGGSLSLKVSGSVRVGGSSVQEMSEKSIVIANSAGTVNLNIKANDDPQRIAVDVAKENKELIIGSTNTKIFELGSITITDQGGKIKRYDGSANYTLPDENKVNLTVTGGAFSASKAAGKVYLEIEGCASSPFPATVADDSTAVWKITDTDNCFKPATDDTVTATIKMEVDGTTEIKPLPSNPLGTFEFILAGNEKGRIITGKLRPLKDNGTKCTVYNVPDGTAGQGAVDKVSVRITNKTGTAGFINASLIDESGVNLFGSAKRIVESIEPYQTVRLYTGAEEAPAVPEHELSQYASRHWGGERAKLVILSNVQNLEVLATVRNINGGAQMNMSTGATGSGCD